MTEEEKNEQQSDEAPEAAAEEAPETVPEEATEEAAPAEPEAPAEEAAEAPAEEPAPAEAPAEPAGGAPAPAEAEPAAQPHPKERRRHARSQHRGEARPARTQEERAAERAEARKAKAEQRRRVRAGARQRRRDQPKAEPPQPVAHGSGRPKVRQGVVVSDKADKTITVRIDAQRAHRTYGKIVRSSATLHAHDEQNEAGVGDTVRVVESRPVSRSKRWRLVEVLERAR